MITRGHRRGGPIRPVSRTRPASLTGVRALRVGLTGGIGAGKSEVSRRLASYGAVVIDADAAAREVVAPGTPGLAEVVAEFRQAALRSDGTLDRDRLGETRFAADSVRLKMNAMLHHRGAERTG